MQGREEMWKMWLSETNSCIKCDQGQNLLVCSENDCLLAVHEKCMACPARFDDEGRFYCPHCFHRKAVRELHRAWENAMLKKKALSMFEMIGSEKNLEEKRRAEAIGPNQSEGGGNVNMSAFDDGKCGPGTDMALHQSVETDKNAQAGIHHEGTENHSPIREGKTSKLAYKSNATKNSEKINDNKCDMEPIVACGIDVLSNEAEGTSKKDEMLARAENEEHVDCHILNKIVGSHEDDACMMDSTKVHDPSIPSREQLDKQNMQQEQKISSLEEDSIQEEVSRGSSDDVLAQTGSKRRVERNDSSDVDHEAISARMKNAKHNNRNKNKQTPQKRNPPRRASTALRTVKGCDEEVGTSRRLNQSERPAVNLAIDLFVGGKRKRLMWRKEEEEMLKEGVQKFAASAKQNLPWRKILEFGRHVFDETRTPVDLKDKWRNLLGR